MVNYNISENMTLGYFLNYFNRYYLIMKGKEVVLSLKRKTNRGMLNCGVYCGRAVKYAGSNGGLL